MFCLTSGLTRESYEHAVCLLIVSHTQNGQKRMISLLTQSNEMDLTHTKMVKNYAEADCAGMGLVRGLRNLTVMVKLVKYN